MRRVTHTTLATHSRKAKIDLQPITDETERIIAGHNNENYELIKDLVAHLPDDDRQAVRLFLEGYSYKEIAAALGITESNVKVRFHRIKQKLKEIYTKLYGNEK